MEDLEVWKPQSRIFEDWRKLGYVSNAVPLVLRYVHTRRENLIVTCTGESINTYAGQSLKLLSTSGISGKGDKPITCMATDTYHVYTAVGNVVYAWRRGTELKRTYKANNDIILLLPFGDQLIAVDEKSVMMFWNIKDAEMDQRVYKRPKTTITTIMHPLGFVNKILIGTAEGEMNLFNIDSSWSHTFTTFLGKRINAIEQAPSIGVVAVALSNKKVVLHNIEYDVVIMSLDCIDEATSIAFRTDGLPVMMVGGKNGSISAWDLDRKEVICYEKEAHQMTVTGLVSFMNEPIMVSSSPDNSVKVWIFDNTDGGFRLLTSRDGHRKPPRMIKFYGEKGFDILSVGDDKCLRRFHIYNETYNRTINNYRPQSEIEKERGVPITDFAIVGGKNHLLFEDIVGYSVPGGRELYTFSFENAKRGLNLRISPHIQTEVTCVCISACNQFAIVGMKSGEVHLFNVQSKILKKTYQDNERNAHGSEVTAISANNINTVIVTGSLDDGIKFWDFNKRTLLSSIESKYTIDGIFRQRDSNLFGIIVGNFEMWICSYTTQQIVRKLSGCRSPVTAACLAPDAKWVTAATEDGFIRTWDNATANLIDIFRVPMGIILSMDYSPNGQYLACAISGHLGIFLWMNKSMFTRVSLSPIPLTYKPPESNNDSSFCSSVWDEIELEENEQAVENYLDRDQLYGLTVLAYNSNHRWTDLLNLKEIKERNKPIEPAKQHVAPFLLGTTGGDNTFQNSVGLKRGPSEIESTKSKLVKIGIQLSPFSSLLLNDPDSKELIIMMEAMSPSAVDYEIRSFASADDFTNELIYNFLRFIKSSLITNGHFETCNTYLALCIKVYTEEIYKHATMVRILEEIASYLKSGKLRTQVSQIGSLIDHAKSQLL